MGAGALLTTTACTGHDAPVTPPEDFEPGPVGATSCATTLDTLKVSFSKFIADLDYSASGSELYVPPPSTYQGNFRKAADLLVGGNVLCAKAKAHTVYYDLVRVIDTDPGGGVYDCLIDAAQTDKHRGVFCARDSAARHRSLHILAPHPLFDSQTNREAAFAFRDVEAAYFSVSTCHRCSNAAATTCDGSTEACGSKGRFRVSDMGHNVSTFFQIFTEAVADHDPDIYHVELHGCGSGDCPNKADGAGPMVVAVTSVGSDVDLLSTRPVRVFTEHFEEGVAAVDSTMRVYSCNRHGDPDILCGTTNQQGRYVNGAKHPCNAEPQGAFSADSKFIHIEQSADFRYQRAGLGYSILTEALKKTFEVR